MVKEYKVKDEYERTVVLLKLKKMEYPYILSVKKIPKKKNKRKSKLDKPTAKFKIKYAAHVLKEV